MARWIYGKHAVIERLKAKDPAIDFVALAKGMKDSADIEQLCRAAKIKIEYHDRKWLDDRTDKGAHQGVAAAAKDFKYADLSQVLSKSKQDSLLVVLDGLEDPHNLGAVLRTAECAGCLGVVIPKDRAVQVTAVVEKSSAGAASLIPVASVTNLSRALEEIKKAGFWVYGLAGSGESLYKEKLQGKVCLVLGAEGKGLRPLVAQNCDKLLGIPLRGKIDSLNVSVAAGIALFEARRQNL